jgi:hypothetical protein
MKLVLPLVLFAGLVSGQTPAAFDVASVKLKNSGTGVDRIWNSGGTLNIENVSLRRLIFMDSHPSIFAAIEEQLGLRMERRKVSLDVLVIDHANKMPTAN